MNKIGILDSGLGGLTVMREMRRLMPTIDMIYLADTKGLPYGDKTPQEIQKHIIKPLDFFEKMQVDLLVIACHTISCTHLATIKNTFSRQVLGISQTTQELLSKYSKIKEMAIIGTKATIESDVYQKTLSKAYPHINFFSIACPLFVPLIEEGGLSETNVVIDCIARTLRPLKSQSPYLEKILLACTHYDLISNEIDNFFGKTNLCVNPAKQCALKAHALLGKPASKNRVTKSSNLEFYVTGDAFTFAQLAKKLFPDLVGRKPLIQNPLSPPKKE